MLLNKDSFKLNSLSMGKYVESIEFGYNKMWGPDSGRNMKAVTTGTFLGVIPKFRLNFIKLSQEELETLAPILDSAWQEATYYDPKLKRNTTIDTYTGDWATLNKNTFSNVARANEKFSISVIATEPRED